MAGARSWVWISVHLSRRRSGRHSCANSPGAVCAASSLSSRMRMRASRQPSARSCTPHGSAAACTSCAMCSPMLAARAAGLVRPSSAPAWVTRAASRLHHSPGHDPRWVFGWKTDAVNHTTAIFRQINKDKPNTHHDALEFPDGQIVLLTRLADGQQATVLQLPADPASASKVQAQEDPLALDALL